MSSSIAKTCREARSAFQEVGAVVLRNVFEKQTLRQVRNTNYSKYCYITSAESKPIKRFLEICQTRQVLSQNT